MARRESSTDPRAIRTRETLIDSTIELLKDNRSEDLSVSQIVKAGNLSRQVFYEHFPDRDSLLVAAGERIIEPSIRRAFEEADKGNGLEEPLVACFETLAPHRDSMANLSDGPAHWRLHSYSVEKVYPLIENEMRRNLREAGEQFSEDQLHYTAQFVASGMTDQLTALVRLGFSAAKAQEVNLLVRETLRKVLTRTN